jgi:hypothetical protein
VIKSCLRSVAFLAALSWSTLACAAAPTASTSAATLLTSSSAVLNGTANPGAETTTGYFRASATNPVTCNNTFGTRVPFTNGVNLGAGVSDVPYSLAFGSLNPATTYYFCAISQNASGTALGAVLSFTTPAALPTLSTLGASNLAASSAVLRAYVTPGGAATTLWFRYATVSPGACNDTFGTRYGGMSIGSDIYPSTWGLTTPGLSPATTYYYCAIAQNSVGTAFGAVVSFTTLPLPPTTTTTAASLVTSSSATVNGTANPNSGAATGWFRYATSSPGSCNDAFGTRAPATGGSSLGSGTTAVAYSLGLTGLAPGTTYYYCAIASSTGGTSFGSVLSFTTAAALPSVTTEAASPVYGTQATLAATVTPGGAATTGWFRYATTSPGTCNDTFGTRAPATGGTAVGSGLTPGAVAQGLTGLSPATTYYFCAIAQSSAGTSLGSVLSFTTTSGLPTVTTLPADTVTASSARLAGSGRAGDPPDAIAWFSYAPYDPGSCNDAFGTSPPIAWAIYPTSTSSLGTTVSGLTPATTYWYCAQANSRLGRSFGALVSFTTLAAAPTVTTSAASAVLGASATLGGTANPGGAATTGWFRYGTTNPGTCDDAFGTRAPASGGSALGSGTAGVAYTQALTGLAPGTTYFACAIASNSMGISFGAPVSFTTPASPTVATGGAGLGVPGATLNATANPNGVATRGHFRYATTDPGACSDAFGTRAPLDPAVDPDLGSGTSPMAYAYVLDLPQGTTYWFCAIASSAGGTAFGAVQSFTTLAAPAVTTSAASAVTAGGATLGGSANPGGAATTGWFRYATASPGACNDTFGTRTPAVGGTSLGAGLVSVDFSQAITGLTPATTYHACAIAQNGVGISLGAVVSFTTGAEAPTVTTGAATSVTSTGATLHGAANPGGDATTGWFRHATVDPGVCNDTFGTRAPATGGTALGAGLASVDFSQALTGLTPGTTSYACAIASNGVGTAFGPLVTVTTPADVPAVTTLAATGVTASGATLHGTASPGGGATTGWFRYDTAHPGACDDAFGTRVPVIGGADLGSGLAAAPFAETLTGLSPGTTYYFCAVASNGSGTGLSAIASFTTPGVPTVTTEAATAVSSTGATLNGLASPNLLEAIGWFRYDTASPAACDDAFGTRTPAGGGTALGAGGTPVPFDAVLTGLQPATTYHYCAIAENALGTRFGDLTSVTTDPAAPAVTTAAATLVTNHGAQLNGAAVPNGDAATGWFRYATVDPSACDDAFGTRLPASGGVDLGAGTEPVPFSAAASGLDRGVTYFVCAIASNSLGTSFGAVQAVQPGSTSPLVSTGEAGAVTGSGATLAGSADPNGSAATGWFRYGLEAPATCDDGFGTRAPAAGDLALGGGSGAVGYEAPVTGLLPNATYSYCAAAANLGGATFGAVRSFTTAAVPPGVTTGPAAVAASGEVTLEALADPRGAQTTTWFRLSATDPGACSDDFGRRWPASGGTDVGAGRSQVHVSEVVIGLAPGRYWACAIGSSDGGLGFGALVAFDVPQPPATGSGSGGGCGCQAVGASGAAGLAWMALLLLAVRPRRRGR